MNYNLNIHLLIICLLFTGCSSTEINSSDSWNLLQKSKESSLYGKSVAIFGGSISANFENSSAKDIWKEYMDFNITNYGKGGYGFSSQQGSIQNQVDNAEIHDIYILWASTNDFVNNRQPGEVTDYTITDHYNEKNRETQCGGINYSIRKIKEKNPKAIILFFTSLPFFSNASGYNESSIINNSIGYNFYYYVNLQKQCCVQDKIIYFDQWGLGLFTEDNYKKYYESDKLHLNALGYELLTYCQLLFFSQQ